MSTNLEKGVNVLKSAVNVTRKTVNLWYYFDLSTDNRVMLPVGLVIRVDEQLSTDSEVHIAKHNWPEDPTTAQASARTTKPK